VAVSFTKIQDEGNVSHYKGVADLESHASASLPITQDMAAFAQKDHAIETKNYTTIPTGYREPAIGETGFAAIPAKTIIEVFGSTVDKHGGRNALALKRPVQVWPTYHT